MESPGITQALQHRVGLEELVLGVLALLGVTSHRGNVLHHQLPRLRLPGPALTSQDDGLVLAPVPQLMPGTIRQRVAEIIFTLIQKYLSEMTYICGGI